MAAARLQLKRDPRILVVYVALIVCSTYLLAKGVITLRELSFFFGGSSFVPAWLGLTRDSRAVIDLESADRATRPDPPRADRPDASRVKESEPDGGA